MTTRPPHLIAEAGTNHGGDVRTGKRLIDAGVAGGADSVKFQMIFPEGLYLPRFYEDGIYRDSEVFYQRSATALAPDDYRELAEYCRARGTSFSASVFDQRGVELVDELNVAYIKIASCDLNNAPLLRIAAQTGRRIILSTGMSTLQEIEQAVAEVQAVGCERLVLMHCVSVYPCPTGRMNLSFIDTLKTTFDLQVGLSDHTENSVAAAIAVSKGVTWIEKHLTLDRSTPGFDHAYAMEPEAFAGYARDVVQAHAACTCPDEKVQFDEREVRARARRALYASRDIEAGVRITEKDVLIVRPEGPLPPNALELVVGATARRTIRQYEALSWEILEEPVASVGGVDARGGR